MADSFKIRPSDSGANGAAAPNGPAGAGGARKPLSVTIEPSKTISPRLASIGFGPAPPPELNASEDKNRRADPENAPQYSTVAEYVQAMGGKKPISKILIANNGIAAVKAIRSIRKWAYEVFGNDRTISFVAMATPEDLKANAEYIHMADEFVTVPGGTNNNNYANVMLIAEVAERTGANAVWAGWGHASEYPKLPETLAKTKSGVIWIGPPPQAMRDLGDKIGSTLIAQSAGVSCMPWSGDGIIIDYAKTGILPDVYRHACVRTSDEALAAADKIGYPVMIKASEGGGGKGIRKVEKRDQIELSFSQVQGEVPGSPIFLMKLAPMARHLEVQLMADQWGDAIAIFGRDCSIQRRHQKIIEEGPVVAAPPEVWRQMEKAAVRLAKTVGYVGAGTVEYLYTPDNQYYFLELNPRLQVEHPVTELISGVNLPAAQLQIAMGVPLHRLPGVRGMYGRTRNSDSTIDFEGETPKPLPGHVIACRITAENPEAAFQPTSGAIKELNFRSTPDVWGYFSVGASGGVHEYSDSQFGHLFSFGATREMARRNMVVALKELSIRGEIRTTIEYLPKVLEHPDFIKNNVSTTWLERVIKHSEVQTEKPDDYLTVLLGCLFRAYQHSASRMTEYMGYLERGQMPPQHLHSDLVQLKVDLIYQKIKYPCIVTRSGANSFDVRVGNDKQVISGDVHPLADGGLLVILDGKKHVVYGQDFPSGLRLIVDGKTCLFSVEYDPTQLRSSMAGKLVRYLVPDGAHLDKGQPYAEMEVMKMYVTLMAPEKGCIKHIRPEGSVLETGDLIARLDVDDPKTIERAEVFDRDFPAFGPPHNIGEKPNNVLGDALKKLENLLSGFKLGEGVVDTSVQTVMKCLRNPRLPVSQFEDVFSALSGRVPEALFEDFQRINREYAETVSSTDRFFWESPEPYPAMELQTAIDSTVRSMIDGGLKTELQKMQANLGPLTDLIQRYRGGNHTYAVQVLMDLLNSYYEVEHYFATAKRPEVVIKELRKAYKDDLQRAVRISLAHHQLEQRNALVIKMLDIVGQQLAPMVAEFVPILRKLASLNTKGYAPVLLKARQLLIKHEIPSNDQRKIGIQTILSTAIHAPTPEERIQRLSLLVDQSQPIADVIFSLLDNAPPALRSASMEVYIRRLYQYFSITKLQIEEDAGKDFVKGRWEFFMDVHKLEEEIQAEEEEIQRVHKRSGAAGADASAAPAGSAVTGTVALPKPVTGSTDAPTDGSTAPSDRAAGATSPPQPGQGMLTKMRPFGALNMRTVDSVANLQALQGDSAVPVSRAAQFKAAQQQQSSPVSPAGSPLPSRTEVKQPASSTASAAAAGVVTSPSITNGANIPSPSGALNTRGLSDPMSATAPLSRIIGRVPTARLLNVSTSNRTPGSSAASETFDIVVHRVGIMAYFRSFDSLKKHFQSLLNGLPTDAPAVNAIPDSPSEPVHVLYVACKWVQRVPPDEQLTTFFGSFLKGFTKELSDHGVRRVTFIVAHAKMEEYPSFFTYHHRLDYAEDMIIRHIEPSNALYMELPRLSNFQLRFVPTTNRMVHMFAAVPVAVAEKQSQELKTAAGKPGAAPLKKREDEVYDGRRFFARVIVRQVDSVFLGDPRQTGADPLPVPFSALPLGVLPDDAPELRAVRPIDLDAFPETEFAFVEALNSLELAVGKESNRWKNNNIFINVLVETALDIRYIESVIRLLARRYSEKIRRLNVTSVEFQLNLKPHPGAQVVLPVRFVGSNPTGAVLRIHIYGTRRDQTTGNTQFYSLDPNSKGDWDGKDVLAPYPVEYPFEKQRRAAEAAGTTYVYDFVELLQKALRVGWRKFRQYEAIMRRMHGQSDAARKSSDTDAGTSGVAGASAGVGADGTFTHPFVGFRNSHPVESHLDTTELILVATDKPTPPGVQLLRQERDGYRLGLITRPPGQNNIGMVAWHLNVKTPMHPHGREVIAIANDISFQAGTFGVLEDLLFQLASEYARQRRIPRIYLSANSGARIGLADEVRSKIRVAWTNNDPLKGYQYLYLSEQDYQDLKDAVMATRLPEGQGQAAGEVRWVITDIIGRKNGLGVENLRGSGMIAGESSQAYDEILTLTYVTGRAVGIGSYLARLGQRVIQKKDSSIILTGFSALNKLLGRPVYSSNVQLGGIDIMYTNGVSHLVVDHDLEGISAIITWLSYTPASRAQPLPAVLLAGLDPIERAVTYRPPNVPYDPRYLIEGANDDATGQWQSGFFDRGSFMELLGGWARTVVVGRARLGGYPMGVIAVETRSIEDTVPADPAAPESKEQVLVRAGQVWYPDSAYKTAQAIKDLQGEDLPIMMFANWRGFSGGMQDMLQEVLKFGSYIVDNLRTHTQPVFVYLPTHATLRGGAWVVVDPTINERFMEMYADQDARGGVLEAEGTVDVKFRKEDILAMAHRLDPTLIALNQELASAGGATKEVHSKIAEREAALLPVYHQVAVAFCDLHDTPGRMKAKQVIRDIVKWRDSRKYFYWRLRRRISECRVLKELSAVLSNGSGASDRETWLAATAELRSLVSSDAEVGEGKLDALWKDDPGMTQWYETHGAVVDQHVAKLKTRSMQQRIVELGTAHPDALAGALGGVLSQLPSERKAEMVAALQKLLAGNQ